MAALLDEILLSFRLVQVSGQRLECMTGLSKITREHQEVREIHSQHDDLVSERLAALWH